MQKTLARARLRRLQKVDFSDRIKKIKKSLMHLKDSVSDKTSDAIYQSLKNAKSRSAKIHKKVDRFVTKKPLRTLGVSMIVGMCIGYLFHK